MLGEFLAKGDAAKSAKHCRSDGRDHVAGQSVIRDSDSDQNGEGHQRSCTEVGSNEGLTRHGVK